MSAALTALGACGEDHACFSPSQNLDRAYEDGAFGCMCEMTPVNQAGFCLTKDDGTSVALICEADAWQAVLDGPCWPPGLITPELCAERGGEVLDVPAPNTPHSKACPEGRELLGAITTDAGEAPCCKLSAVAARDTWAGR